MADEYKIYLVNNSPSTQIFWCFLEKPEQLASDPLVFANSQANLQIESGQPGFNSFTIPVQYLVGASAGNEPVGSGVVVESSVINDASLKDQWYATYADVPPNQGPTMEKTGTASEDNTIEIKCNPFNKEKNEANNWYSNMSFGVQTPSGFIGMTWSPEPNKTKTLTPKLSFYVSVGSYGSNELVDFTTISNDAAEISVPDSFDAINETTVTYTETGEWIVTPGKPDSTDASNFARLIQSHLLLSKSHTELVGLFSSARSEQRSINQNVKQLLLP